MVHIKITENISLSLIDYGQDLFNVMKTDVGHIKMGSMSMSL